MRLDWILLRGLGRESGHWHDFPKLLEQKIPGVRAVTLDLPGTGEYYKENSPFGIPAIVDFLEEKARLNRVSFPAFLLGISFGGMIAIEWLRRRPQQFQGAVLINTSLGGVSPFYERMQPRGWSLLAKIPLTKQIEQRESFLMDWVCHNRSRRAERLREWVQISTERPISNRNLLTQLGSALVYRPILEKSSHPLLILVSKYDQLASANCSQQIKVKLGGELREHPTAGHELTVDDPVWVAETIRKWKADLI